MTVTTLPAHPTEYFLKPTEVSAVEQCRIGKHVTGREGKKDLMFEMC